MKFKPGNLYTVSYHLLNGTRGNEIYFPFCIKELDYIEMCPGDIFLYLEKYKFERTRYVNKILFDGKIYCFDEVLLNESRCQLIETEDIENKNWLAKIGKNILDLFV